MSFPPFPPNARYSPSRSYGDQPYPSPASLPPFPPNSAAPPSAYRPYDAYGSEPPRQPYPYDQPGRAYESEAYDPYQPASSSSSVYDPITPQMRLPPAPSYLPPRTEPQRSAPLANTRSTPAPAPSNTFSASSGAELSILTDATTIDIDGEVIPVHSLPPSHLPIRKFVAMNAEDAIAVHRQLCRNSVSIWYAGGSSRAGEGWSAAVEWIIDSSRSGSKMRGCLGDADGLETELGGILKAVEGFQELLHQSIKDGKPMSHELIVFSDSQAAIVAIDTSSTPQSLQFEQLWKQICSEYLQAQLVLAWLPAGTKIEGLTLANRIATVGATNSYAKKKKENTLPDIYRRPGGGDPAPSGSSFAGAWQRGDADPSRRKAPFERPRIQSPTVEATTLHDADHESEERRSPETERGGAGETSIFVTSFPDEISAKDIGILFAQYGNILGVDIYHISPQHPRFATVTFTDPASGHAAIQDLHRKAINLESPFARENRTELLNWAQWSGQLAVVMAEPPRLVPASMAAEFPDLPDWALGSGSGGSPDRSAAPELAHDSDGDVNAARKRDRSTDGTPDVTINSITNQEATPRKRARQSASVEAEPSIQTGQNLHPKSQENDASLTTQAAGDHTATHSAPKNMPPFPPPVKSDSGNSLGFSPPIQQSITLESPILPPTPISAERPSDSDALAAQDANRAANSKSRLTNSASEPQEYPIKVGAKTLRAQIDLVRGSFIKVDVSNWIAHACFIASAIDQSRRALQEDLYHTDNGFITGRELEKTLSTRGFTPDRVDAFITKVLKVLDGIALAEQDENGAKVDDTDDVATLEKELEQALASYPDQTKEAMSSASVLMEYLTRGKEAQDRKRLEIERRVKVLEGMAKVGEVVGGVVRFLLSENK